MANTRLAGLLRQITWHDLLAGIQWLLFMFANTVVIPVSVGTALHMNSAGITASMQRSFFYTGLASLLQLFWGHGLPLMEGQSGVWWGAILGVLATAEESGLPLLQAGGSLETGIVISGVMIVVLGWLGMGEVLRKWFTPVVSSVFLMLLAVELTSIFMKGMLGLSDQQSIQVPVTILSLFLFVLVLAVQLSSFKALRNYAILIGIAVGWAIYRVGMAHAAALPAASVASLWGIFPWGPPGKDIGILLTVVAAGLVNASNTVATLESAKPLLRVDVTKRMYKRSFFITGFSTIVAGFMGLVPYAPYTSSLGLLQSTQIFSKIPFALGAVLLLLLGLVPAAGSFFATLPVSVGDAVLVVAYLQLFGPAMQYIEGMKFDHRTIYRLALPVLMGIAVFTVAAKAFTTLPPMLRPFLSNGLLVGVLLAVVLENTMNWKLSD